MNILITGATGFIGTAVLVRILRQQNFKRIFLLVRPTKRADAAARVEDLLKQICSPEMLPGWRKRVVAVAGDLTKPNLGIEARVHFELQSSLHQILHIGASTDFGAPIDESRLYNVTGTQYLLDLARLARRHGVLQRFDYVSTAFVAGIKRGQVDEKTLIRGQKFANNYEQSKYEAERLVKQYAAEVPTAIYRPSIVVGDSRNGYTPHFKVLYWPLKLLSKQVIPMIPCNLRSRLDVVPIDYVADGLVALMSRKLSLGETFHLTSGGGGEVSMKRVLGDAIRYAGIKSVPVIPMWVFDLVFRTPLRRLLSKEFIDASHLAAPYYHYLKGCHVKFDAKKTQRVLASLGIRVPRWEDYHQVVLKFCRETGWGRRLKQPVYGYLEQ